MRVLLSFLILVFSVSPALAQDKSAQASCKVVATVYAKDICESEITASEKAHANLEAYAKKNGQDADKTQLNVQHANLFARIWEIALIEKFGAAALEPSEKEVESFLKLQGSAMKQQYGFDKELAAIVKEQLGKYDYPQDVHQKLNRLGADKQKAVAIYEKRKELPDDIKARVDAGEQKAAYAIVKGWKVKKLLYETYGGRVAFMQTEMEPVDAYKQFLGEITKGENAVIRDTKYKDVFKTMEDYIAKNENFVPDGAPEVKAYFAAPGWIYSSDIGKQLYGKVKQSILAMPEAGVAKPKGAAIKEAVPAAEAKKE